MTPRANAASYSRARREARREQHALRRQLRQRREHVLEFALRHAFQAEAFVDERAQDRRMRIGLDRVEAAVDRGDARPARARVRAPWPGRRRSAACRACAASQQRVARARPPRRARAAACRARSRASSGRTRCRRRTGIAPLRISSACSCGSRPSASASSMTKVRLRSLDDCEIRCTRSRPNVAQMSDSLCSSERMPRPTSVIAAHGAITLTRQTSARSARQRFEHVGGDQVLARVQRHGDVGFRRADQVDRQAVALEALEHVGEEADLLPHADAFHRHQHDAVAAADRLDARARSRRWRRCACPAGPGARCRGSPSARRASRHGAIERGCSTLAPVVAISCASA